MQDQDRITAGQALQKAQKLSIQVMPDIFKNTLPYASHYQVWTYHRCPGRKATGVSKKKRTVDGFVFIFLFDSSGRIGEKPFISIHRTSLTHAAFVSFVRNINTSNNIIHDLFKKRLKKRKAQQIKHHIPRHKRKPSIHMHK